MEKFDNFQKPKNKNFCEPRYGSECWWIFKRTWWIFKRAWWIFAKNWWIFVRFFLVVRPKGMQQPNWLFLKTGRKFTDSLFWLGYIMGYIVGHIRGVQHFKIPDFFFCFFCVVFLAKKYTFLSVCSARVSIFFWIEKYRVKSAVLVASACFFDFFFSKKNWKKTKFFFGFRRSYSTKTIGQNLHNLVFPSKK